MTPRAVVLELARIEAANLAGIVAQFAQLLAESTDSTDPAVERLTPAAYADDADAAREFRAMTHDELLERRSDDAATVLASLGESATLAEDLPDEALTELTAVVLDAQATQAWLRTLAAIRLVLANRLGIESEDDHDEGDPRFGIYEWIGYRLDGLVRALDE